jgi:hypothetical protein
MIANIGVAREEDYSLTTINQHIASGKKFCRMNFSPS